MNLGPSFPLIFPSFTIKLGRVFKQSAIFDYLDLAMVNVCTEFKCLLLKKLKYAATEIKRFVTVVWKK